MLAIKVILKDDEFSTRINATLEEVARYYFPIKAVQKIEILSGGVVETEYFKKIPLEIYRVPQEEVDEFQLWNNIRLRFYCEYKKGQAKNEYSSSGLCNIL